MLPDLTVTLAGLELSTFKLSASSITSSPVYGPSPIALYSREDNDFFDNYPNSSKGLVISYMIEPYKDELENNGYSIESNM